MATHDYNIANDTGANVRSDINSVLEAIRSNNSDGSAPSNTFAYQWHVDTSPGSGQAIMKVRDDVGGATGSAYINLFEVKAEGQTFIGDGTITKPGLAFRSDINTGLRRSSSDGALSLVTASIRRLTVLADGKVGIAQATPTEILHVNGNIKATEFIFIGETGAPENVTDSTVNPEKVRIKNNQISANGDNNASLLLNRTGNDGDVAKFFRSGGTPSGSISVSASTTAYNESSDHRLKENIVDMADGITRVKQLQPRRFNFIVDAETTVDGFIAHEAQAVVPEAVTGTYNEVDENGDPVMQGIDKSKFVPLLTAALQEAIAKIETLEAKVAALEAGS